MYKYSDSYDNNCISLHDCRATELKLGEDSISFIFDDGFYITKDCKENGSGVLWYTGRSEVVFGDIDTKNIGEYVTVCLFSGTDSEGNAVRDEITVPKLAKKLKSGMELEFLYTRKENKAYTFDCWLWFDTEPYHKECELRISSESMNCFWNELFEEK